MRSVENAECVKCGVWKMRSVKKCGVWKMWSVENEECGKCGVWKLRQFSISIFHSHAEKQCGTTGMLTNL